VAAQGVRSRGVRFRSDALLVRRVAYGEADLIVTLFTEARGLVSAAARAARRSSKRFAALEPMHLLGVTIEERPEAELGQLVETTLVKPRLRLTADLDRLDAAGKLLRWIRRASPPHTPEPALFSEANELLDALDDPLVAIAPRALLAAAGLRILMTLGWGLDLARCVRCGRLCDPSAAACIDPARGGLVCRSCGGARFVLRAERRSRLSLAAAGDASSLDAADAEAAIDLVDQALTAHGGLHD